MYPLTYPCTHLPPLWFLWLHWSARVKASPSTRHSAPIAVLDSWTFLQCLCDFSSPRQSSLPIELSLSTHKYDDISQPLDLSFPSSYCLISLLFFAAKIRGLIYFIVWFLPSGSPVKPLWPHCCPITPVKPLCWSSVAPPCQALWPLSVLSSLTLPWHRH